MMHNGENTENKPTVKRGLFINLCILCTICIIQIRSPVYSYGFVRMIPIISYMLVIINTRHIFISREDRIEKKQRAWLYVLIGSCYGVVVATIIADYLERELVEFILNNALVTLLLSFISIYLNAMFRSAKKEQQ